jgi:hypothetical protein
MKRAPWWLRAVFVAAALAGWFWTQSLIGSRVLPEDVIIGDEVHELLANPHQYFSEHREAAHILLILSSTVIDLVGVLLLLLSIFGPTLRPFIGLLIVFALRQVCQMLCPLRGPPGMIWESPGLPSLLVTYDVATDFFFSGHTALATLGAVEVVRYLGRGWWPLGLAIIAFESCTVLILRAHYTMDVFTGAVVALYASVLAAWWAPWWDSLLAGFGPSHDQQSPQ